MGGHVWVIGKFDWWLGWMKHVVRVDIVHDLDVMSRVAKGMRKAIDVHCIAAEVVRRIKCCQVQEIERTRHRPEPLIS